MYLQHVVVEVKKIKEGSWGEILTETGNRNRNIRKQHLLLLSLY